METVMFEGCTEVSDGDLQNLVKRLRAGEIAAKNPLIKAHIPLAIKIAKSYWPSFKRHHPDDILAAALQILVEAVDFVHKYKVLHDDNIGAYLNVTIQRNIMHFITSDCLMPVDAVTKKKLEEEGRGHELPKIQSILMLDRERGYGYYSIDIPEYTSAFENCEVIEILSKLKLTMLEQKFLRMRLEGYKLREIAEACNCSTAYCDLILKSIGKRYLKWSTRSL